MYCIYQCQSDMCGVIIYSVTQIYVLKGYKTTLQPSHPISQRITVSTIYSMRVCVCVFVCLCVCGRAYDTKNVLSILSRGDVLKGTLVINKCMRANRKGTFCGFAKK